MGTAKRATLEDAWEIVKELAKSQKETDRQLKGLGKSQEETDRQLKGLGKSQAETDRQLKETARQLKETDSRFNSQWGKLVESLIQGNIVENFRSGEFKFKEPLSGQKKLSMANNMNLMSLSTTVMKLLSSKSKRPLMLTRLNIL